MIGKSGMTSPFYPTNHTYAGKPMTQEEVFSLFNNDQGMRLAAWMQSGGEFFAPHELRCMGEGSDPVAQLRKENDVLRKKLAESKEPCVYCGLPAEDLAKCPHGFPGCGRADDMLLGK